MKGLDQELLNRIIVALYKRLFAGSLLVIIPELPWGMESFVHLTECLAAFGWKTDIVATESQVSKPFSGRLIQGSDPFDWTDYQKIWVPAIPLNVLSRLKALNPHSREETMILEALMAGIPVGSPQKSWMPPQIRSMAGGSDELNLQVADLCGTLASWGMNWVPDVESGSWVMGNAVSHRDSVWSESVLPGSGVRLLGPDVQTLRIQKGTVITAVARDELSRRRIRLIGDR